MSVSADPPVQSCPFIIWHFSLNAESWSVLWAFLDSFVWKLSPWEFSSSVFLHLPHLRACGPLSPGCMHSIYSNNLFRDWNRLIPVWAEKYLIGHSHSVKLRYLKRGLLTAVLPHTVLLCIAVHFIQEPRVKVCEDELGISLMDRKYLLRHINSSPVRLHQ